MLYIYLNYTENGSSYPTKNRSLLNYEENSKFMQEKIALPSQNVMNTNKMHYTSTMQDFRTLCQAVNMFTTEP